MDVKGGVGREVGQKEIYASPGRHTDEIYTGRVRRSLRPPVFPVHNAMSPPPPVPFPFRLLSCLQPCTAPRSSDSWLRSRVTRTMSPVASTSFFRRGVAKFHYIPEMRRNPAFFFKTELHLTTFEPVCGCSLDRKFYF